MLSCGHRSSERSNEHNSFYKAPGASITACLPPERDILASRKPSPLEALLPRPGRREIYLREIVSPKYSYLSKPYQNSYLRTYVLYRSLHWRTRLCLQPEGIV